MQRDIVVLLEEAGSETLRTVVATLKPMDTNQLTSEIDGLVALGLVVKVEAADESDTELVLTEAGRRGLRT